MNKIFTLVAFLLISASAFSQTGSVRGKLADSTSKQSLKDASVTVLNGSDSTLEVFGLTKADGSFSILNIPYGKMLVQIKFQGYETVNKTVTFSSSNSSVDLGTVFLKPSEGELAGVTVTASPIRVKGDTIEVSASSFKTKPNAVAEDLLKKIPGMEVGKDGTIKSQGETVQRVLVNGKRFFGDDPKMATKNLPPDMIDKIQVFDDQSDQAKFSGFDDGNRVKTLNITTKKEARKGAFGRVVAGLGSKVGDDLRYDESFNLSVMNGEQQWTFLGQANNINKQNFTQQNIGGGRGGNGGGGGGGTGGGGTTAGGTSGITTILAGGINYRDAWSKNIDAYGSYFYNAPKVFVDQSSNTQTTVTPDSVNVKNEVSQSNSRNENHRFTFNLENRLDSNNSLIFRPNLVLQNSSPDAISRSTTVGGPNNTPINSLMSKSSSYNHGYSISGSNLTLRHKFAKKGRTLSLDLGFSASENNGDGLTYSINQYFKPTVKTDTLNQHYFDSTKSVSFSPTLSYTEAINKSQQLEFRYSYSYNNSTTINSTYDFDNAGGKFSKFDSLFSNSYKYTSISHTGNISWRIQKTKFNMNIGAGLQFLDINSNNTTKNVIVARDFVNFTPTVNFTYNFSRTRNLRLFYSGRTGQPSTSQLQPITTTTDSVNFQIGNPNLKPQFTNSLRLLYTSFDPFTQRVVFATINATVVSNDIQNYIIQNANGGRTTQYVNLNGTYNLTGYFNYGFPIKSPKSNLNFQTNASYAQSQSLLSSSPTATAQNIYTRSTVVGETVKWTTNLKNNFDMNLSAAYSINPVRSTQSSVQSTNYTTASVAADFTAYTNNGWTIASDFDLTMYGNRPVGYNTSVFLITPSVAKTFLKNKAGELRLSCFDVLKQNQAITSSAVGNQLVTTRSNNLTRYFMLTFTYNLRNFAGQQQRGNQRGNMFQGQGMPPGMGGFNGGGFGGGQQRRGGN